MTFSSAGQYGGVCLGYTYIQDPPWHPRDPTPVFNENEKARALDHGKVECHSKQRASKFAEVEGFGVVGTETCTEER